MQNGDIRDALQRVLAADGLVNSPNLSAFLSYVVEEKLAGRADRLKAYSIATEALGRSSDFDPNDNPLVRVHARRLRDALARYYTGPGRDDPLRIELPVGTYAPNFIADGTGEPSAEGLAPETGAEAPAHVPHPSETGSEPAAAETVKPARRGGIAWVPIAIILGVSALIGLGAFFAWQYWSTHTERAHRSRLATIEADYPAGKGLDATRILPQVFVEVQEDDDLPKWFIRDLYRNRIETFIQRFDNTVVVRRDTGEERSGPDQPSYRLSITFTRDGDNVLGLMQVLHIDDGRLIASEQFPLRSDMMRIYLPGSLHRTPQDLAQVRQLVQVYGAIFNDIINLERVSEPLACLHKGYGYYLDSNARNHSAARACLEKTIVDNPRLAPAFSLLGAMYLTEYRREINRLPGDPLERAEAAMRRAIQLAPTSSIAYQNLQSLMLVKGDINAAVEAGARAVALNPEDMEAIGNYGTVLARVGRHLEAASLLLRAEANSRAVPQWMHFYAFVALNNLGRAEDADRQTTTLVGTRSSLYLAAVAIAAHRRGDETAAHAALEGIQEMEPDFGENPYGLFRRRGFADSVTQILLGELSAAGLELPGKHLTY